MNEIRCFSCGAINPSDKDGIFRKNCWDCLKPLDGTIVAPPQDTPALPKQEGETPLMGYMCPSCHTCFAEPQPDPCGHCATFGKAKQEPDRPVGDITEMCEELAEMQEKLDRACFEILDLEIELSTANATIEALKESAQGWEAQYHQAEGRIESLKEERSAIKRQCEKEPLAFLLSNALRLLSMEQMISLADSLYERTPSGSGIRAELAKYKDQSPKY